MRQLTPVWMGLFVWTVLAAAPAPAGPLEVEVRAAATGEPIPDSLVTLAGPLDAAPADPARTGPAGADGRIRFEECPAGRYDLRVAKGGYEPAPPELAGADYTAFENGFLFADDGRPVTVWLRETTPRATGGIRGQVTAGIGNTPLRNVGVSVVEVAFGGAKRIVHTAQTNAYGSFVLYGIHAGPAKVNVAAPGYQNFSKVVMIPSGQSVDYPVRLGSGGGKISGVIFSEGSIPIDGVQVTATRSDGILVSSALVDVRAVRATGYTLENVPVVPPGTAYTYTVKAACPGAAMTNPAGITGLVVRDVNQVVQAGPIRMICSKGGLLVTLYHPSGYGPGETESLLQQQAPMAVVAVAGTNAYGRYQGESPTHFYSWRIADAPAGNRTLRISFPAHTLATNPATAFIPIGGEARVLFDLRER